MSSLTTNSIRLCEWSVALNHGLSAEERRNVSAAVEAWRMQNDLAVAPLSFGGPEGEELRARQYVGVVEVGSVTIEVFPKLDAALISTRDGAPISASIRFDSVMTNLLWILQVANYRDVAETETAHLEEAPTSFFDLFAYLLAKNLLPELRRGVAHSYLTLEDDLKMVRGRVNLRRQVTRNWNRYDRIDCSWDAFTANTPFNRLFKCACRFLAERSAYLEASRMLQDCAILLSEVEDVTPQNALRDIEYLRFDRSTERFKTAFDLARRLLSGIGHNVGAGSTNTFVFLIDMNELFEKYVHAILEAHFRKSVEQQKFIGRLFRIHPGGVYQFADFFWYDRVHAWIGDAKYKHLADALQPLRFRNVVEDLGQTGEASSLAGHILSAGDIRQLTVYAELVRASEGLQQPPHLAIFYPFVGNANDCLPDTTRAWNGSVFWLVPVLMRTQSRVCDAIRLLPPD